MIRMMFGRLAFAAACASAWGEAASAAETWVSHALRVAFIIDECPDESPDAICPPDWFRSSQDNSIGCRRGKGSWRFSLNHTSDDHRCSLKATAYLTVIRDGTVSTHCACVGLLFIRALIEISWPESANEVDNFFLCIVAITAVAVSGYAQLCQVPREMRPSVQNLAFAEGTPGTQPAALFLGPEWFMPQHPPVYEARIVVGASCNGSQQCATVHSIRDNPSIQLCFLYQVVDAAQNRGKR